MSAIPKISTGLWLLTMGACASAPQMRSIGLAERAQANPLAAQRDLASHPIIVEGSVRNTTLVTYEQLTASSFGSGFFQRVDIGTTPETLPLVVLEPGTVLCYFQKDDLSEAADLRPGENVRLACTVDSFRTDRGVVYAVLGGCRRK